MTFDINLAIQNPITIWIFYFGPLVIYSIFVLDTIRFQGVIAFFKAFNEWLMPLCLFLIASTIPFLSWITAGIIIYLLFHGRGLSPANMRRLKNENKRLQETVAEQHRMMGTMRDEIYQLHRQNTRNRQLPSYARLQDINRIDHRRFSGNIAEEIDHIKY